MKIEMNALLADTSSLDFIANQLYRVDCRLRNEIPLRWLCMGSDAQRRYLERAKENYLEWVDGERSAQVSRQTLGQSSAISDDS